MLYTCSYETLLDYYKNNAETLFPTILFPSEEMNAINGLDIISSPFLSKMDQDEAKTLILEKIHFKNFLKPNKTDTNITNIFISSLMAVMTGCTSAVWTGAIIKSSLTVGSVSFIAIVSIATLLVGLPAGLALYRWYQINDIERKAKLASKQLTDRRIIRLSDKVLEITRQIGTLNKKQDEELNQLAKAKRYFKTKLGRAKAIQRNPDPAPSKS